MIHFSMIFYEQEIGTAAKTIVFLWFHSQNISMIPVFHAIKEDVIMLHANE